MDIVLIQQIRQDTKTIYLLLLPWWDYFIISTWLVSWLISRIRNSSHTYPIISFHLLDMLRPSKNARTLSTTIPAGIKDLFNTSYNLLKTFIMPFYSNTFHLLTYQLTSSSKYQFCCILHFLLFLRYLDLVFPLTLTLPSYQLTSYQTFINLAFSFKFNSVKKFQALQTPQNQLFLFS